MRLSLTDMTTRIARVGGTPAVAYTWLTSAGAVPYPFHDLASGVIRRAVADVWIAQRQERKPHCVVLAYDHEGDADASFVAWCGDSFLEGRAASDRATDLLDLTRRHGGDVAGVRAAIDAVVRHTRGLECGGCRFWRTRQGCPHVDPLWHAVRQDIGTSRMVHDRHVAAFSRFFGARSGIIQGRTVAAIVQSTVFRRPLLLLGPRGAGKTRVPRQLARDLGVRLIEVAGHESVEALDLFGATVPADGRWIWRDGPLSEAFRRASRGERVVLAIDELLRIPARHQSALLTALSLDDTDDSYRLRTGRLVNVNDGVGEEETLIAPRSHIAIIATSNLGVEYNVSTLDPAVAARFKIIDMPTTREAVEAALDAAARRRRLPESTVQVMLAFYDRVSTLCHSSEGRSAILSVLPCPRTLGSVLDLATSPDDVPTLLREEFPQWVARDPTGVLVAEQVDALEKAAAATVDQACATVGSRCSSITQPASAA